MRSLRLARTVGCTLVRRLWTIPADWLDLIVAETARRCIKEADEATGPLGADSSAAETTRVTLTNNFAS